MTKKEVIWREILSQAIENKKTEFTQKELAQKYRFSLSTVFNALKIPRQTNTIEGKRGFKVRDIEKFLYLWATFRKIKKDIIYQTAIKKRVFEIEGEMPPGVIFGAYSAFLKKYKTAPADYDKVYVYTEEKNLKEIKKRFPDKKGYQNLIVLKADPWLKNFGSLTPDCQTFVDLWNLSEWYAKDFLNALKEKILKV
jgi:DNA-binding transcriptional MocR family regulator